MAFSVKVLFDYTPEPARRQEELTIKTGDIINVISSDGDWWEGKLGNRQGFFPGNYVEKIQQTAIPVQRAPPPSSQKPLVNKSVGGANKPPAAEKKKRWWWWWQKKRGTEKFTYAFWSLGNSNSKVCCLVLHHWRSWNIYLGNFL